MIYRVLDVRFTPILLFCIAVTSSAFAEAPAVRVREVSNYIYGGYQGSLVGAPHADGNPQKAFVVSWTNQPYTFVFSHEASYCPWFELPSGGAVSYQFFEGNDGWAELLNQNGRKEQNSFVEIVSQSPREVHLKWTYFGVNQTSGERAYKAVEDFFAYDNGLVLRRQGYETLKPGEHIGYAREPIELIGLAPRGKTWADVLQKNPDNTERHALAALDPFSKSRYDVYWAPTDDLIGATARRTGTGKTPLETWKTTLENSAGIILAKPMRDGTPFVVFGDASGYAHATTNLKDHSYTDTGGMGWVSASWDHWPIGWINSQGHPVDRTTLPLYPNHFASAGMDVWGLSDAQSAQGVYWSLMGVGGADDEAMRTAARTWLEQIAASKDPTVSRNLAAIYSAPNSAFHY